MKAGSKFYFSLAILFAVGAMVSLSNAGNGPAAKNIAMKSNTKSELPDSEAVILLNAIQIHTKSPEAQSLREKSGFFSGKRLHLIQFAGPIQNDWYAALADTRVQIVTYIPFYSYLIYGDAPAIAAVQNLEAKTNAVQWDGAYRAEYKIDPNANPLDQNGDRKANPHDLFQIQLVKDESANVSTMNVIEKFKLEPVLNVSEALGYVNIKARIDPDRVFELAAQNDVVSIQPYNIPKKMDERQDQIIAGILTGNTPTGPGYLSFLAGAGFTQSQFNTSGFGVDVTDSGVGNAATPVVPNSMALYEGGSTSNPDRLVYHRLIGSPNPGSTIAGCDGHGNLNAHIVAGFNDLTGFPHEDGSGFNYDLGVCPFVKIGSSVIFDPNSFTFPNYENLQSQAYHDGMRISTNSWGSDVFGDYDSDSQRYDALVRDAQPSGSTFAVAGNQEMVIVFSAGNAGSGSGSIGSPGTGKNMITVGAAENVNPFGAADLCGISDSGANSANDIISFSSRGPTVDNRFKPEIMAPGTHVSGGVEQSSTNPGTNGDALACFTAGGVCGGPGINFFPAGQEWTTASSGTSHSCPAVAGGAALVRQFFLNHGFTAPSPAMTRAYLINSARYMNGTGANDTLPSNNQGMGEMNLGMAFDSTARILQDESAAQLFTASGQDRVISGTVNTNSSPFRVTLAWTDPPGPTSGNAFINNLDLTVTVGGTTYKGNVFTGANSSTGGSADLRNNLESVFLPAGVTGPFTITVHSTNIAGDGVPGNGTPLDQDFALVCYNCDSAPINFFDDFDDGVLSTQWTYSRLNVFTEPVGTNLVGTAGKKTSAIASPVFGGCTNCTVESHMSNIDGKGNVWLLGWYVNSKNDVELQMSAKKDKWTLKEKINGHTKGKAVASSVIDANTVYDVKIVFDGTTFTVFVDGVQKITLPSHGSHFGTVGFQVTKTTAMFDDINVN